MSDRVRSLMFSNSLIGVVADLKANQALGPTGAGFQGYTTSGTRFGGMDDMSNTGQFGGGRIRINPNGGLEWGYSDGTVAPAGYSGVLDENGARILYHLDPSPSFSPGGGAVPTGQRAYSIWNSFDFDDFANTALVSTWGAMHTTSDDKTYISFQSTGLDNATTSTAIKDISLKSFPTVINLDAKLILAASYTSQVTPRFYETAKIELFADGQNTTTKITLAATAVQSNGYFDIAEIAAPGTPASGYGRIYADTDSLPIYIDDSGASHSMTGGGAAEIISRSTTDASISGTTVAADLLNFSLPANKLTTDGILKIKGSGNMKNGLGSGGAVTINAYLGSTLLGTFAPTVAAGTDQGCKWEFEIYGAGGTSLQEGFLEWAGYSGTGIIFDGGSSAEDTTGALTVRVEAQLPVGATTDVEILLERFDAILYD